MQTSILDILNVVIMMRMTYASFMQFYEMLTWACYEAFVTIAERKGCHGNKFKNDATATYLFR